MSAVPSATQIDDAINLLTGQGFTVLRPAGKGDRRTVGELKSRFGLSAAGLHKRLAHENCPVTERLYTPSGRRLVSVLLTPSLAIFLAQPQQPGRKLRSFAA
jgi:hypothetical protein